MGRQKGRPRRAGGPRPGARAGQGGSARRRSEITVSKKTQAVRISNQRLRRLIRFVAEAEGRAVTAVDLTVVPDAEMAALHRRYLGRRRITDVLSFDLSEPGAAAGGIVAQIVVCGDLAAREARRRGHAARRELMLYVVHGLLHVMGYDHATAGAAARMHAREDELLVAFGEGPAFAPRC